MKLTSVECILCQNDFGSYCVPKSSQHRPAPQKVLRGQVWENDTIEFMRNHAYNRDIIHAGMFFGDFLPGLASALAPGRMIYGFEPNPENFACAQWTAVLNSLTNVSMQNVGLGEIKKHASMRMFMDGREIGGASYILTDSYETSSFDPFLSQKLNTDSADVQSIDIVPIDDILPATADVGILQLDVEGYEKNALIGGLGTIRRCKPIIILETAPLDVIEEHILPIGYKYETRICDNHVYVC